MASQTEEEGRKTQWSRPEADAEKSRGRSVSPNSRMESSAWILVWILG